VIVWVEPNLGTLAVDTVGSRCKSQTSIDIISLEPSEQLADLLGIHFSFNFCFLDDSVCHLMNIVSLIGTPAVELK
jgi:hypothetical protein